MKKLVAIVLALALVFTMSAIAFAAASDTTKQTVTAEGSDGEADVLVKVILDDDSIPPEDQPQDPSDVDPKYATYSVTIDAKDVVFTYTINDIKSYDPATHTYKDGSWDKNNGNIVVTNDSNTSITVTPSWKNSVDTNNGVKATLNTASLNLGSAVDVEGVVSGNINVSIDEKAPTVSENFTLATVVLTIAGKDVTPDTPHA